MPDLTKFLIQLLPPILRTPTLISLLRALITPLKTINSQITQYNTDVSRRLHTTANQNILQKTLNDTFHLQDNQIYITTQQIQPTTTLHYTSETTTNTYLHPINNGKHITLRHPDETPTQENYTIHIPTFLATSTDPTLDKHKGEHLSTIIAILEKYRPAGKKYNLNIYNYE